jgi:LysR family transcriptional regulator, hydrogen peroxide-inducible genes activator
MTLQELRYLVALADHGHFGRAAEACHISQPTLSTQIRKLEEYLGITLFERTNKTVHVTEAAQEIVARARRVLAETDAIVATAQSKSAPLTGPFVLGMIPTLAPYLLPSLIPALGQDFPRLRLVVHEDVTTDLLERLASHHIDAALVALPVADAGFEALPLFDEPFWFAAPRGHELAQGHAVTEEDLRDQPLPLLLLTEGHCLRDQALAICGTDTGKTNGTDFRSTSLETIRQLVATGVGCTLLPAMALGDNAGGAIAVQPLANSLGRRIGLIWRRSYPKISDLRLLANTIRNHLPPSVRLVEQDGKSSQGSPS